MPAAVESPEPVEALYPDLDDSDRRHLADQIARARRKAVRCAQIASEFRGKDVVVLDLTRITPIVDFFVIVTGTNPRQMRALADEVRSTLKVKGQAIQPEDDLVGNWLLQDYGDVVLHVMHPEARTLYDLEGLWGDAPRVEWAAEVERPAPLSAS